MQLSLEDVDRFYRLHKPLMFFVNQRLKVIGEKVADLDAYGSVPPEARLKVHQALPEHLDLIDAFADENPFRFSDEDLEIVRSWKHLVTGTFYAFRYLKAHAIFLSSTDPVMAYGVVALFDPFEAVIGPHLPRLFKATLLPFQGRIVYDGLLSGYNITFGGGVKRRLKEDYEEAKARSGIITSLPPDAGTRPSAAPKAAPRKRAKGDKPTGGRST